MQMLWMLFWTTVAVALISYFVAYCCAKQRNRLFDKYQKVDMQMASDTFRKWEFYHKARIVMFVLFTSFSIVIGIILLGKLFASASPTEIKCLVAFVVGSFVTALVTTALYCLVRMRRESMKKIVQILKYVLKIS